MIWLTKLRRPLHAAGPLSIMLERPPTNTPPLSPRGRRSMRSVDQCTANSVWCCRLTQLLPRGFKWSGRLGAISSLVRTIWEYKRSRHTFHWFASGRFQSLVTYVSGAGDRPLASWKGHGQWERPVLDSSITGTYFTSFCLFSLSFSDISLVFISFLCLNLFLSFLLIHFTLTNLWVQLAYTIIITRTTSNNVCCRRVEMNHRSLCHHC